MLCFLLLLYSRNRDKSLLPTLKQDVLLYLFLGFVIVINSYLWNSEPEQRIFQILSVLALLMFVLSGPFANCTICSEIEFLRQLNHVIKLNIITQLLIYLSGQAGFFMSYWGAIRYMGTFKRP